MKVVIYSPYLDTFGGGERYMMTIAEALISSNTVDVLLDKHLSKFSINYLTKELSERFGLNLEKVNFIPAPVGKGSGFLQRLSFFKEYDLLFYLTDGSIFYPTAKKNILHIQSPLIGQPAKGLWGKIKLKGWDLIIYNSLFTKESCEKYWPIESRIIYPPVDIEKIESFVKRYPHKKKKYILSVGRFFGFLKDKKHELLIKAFKKLHQKQEIKSWSLHLVGAASEGDKVYIEQLKKMSQGYPIFFYPNLDYEKLMKLYTESSIYWHAAGYGEDDPTKMEHFGISTVEAMAGGVVPVVINLGGQKEIVENEKSGFLWNTIEELVNYTLQVIRNEKLREEISQTAKKRSVIFSKDNFRKKIDEVINEQS